jgi:hypothetical protein
VQIGGRLLVARLVVATALVASFGRSVPFSVSTFTFDGFIWGLNFLLCAFCCFGRWAVGCLTLCGCSNW